MNLIFLIVNLFITSLIYDMYVKGVMYKYSIGWLIFNDINVLEILISYCFLVLIQNAAQSLILFVSRLCREGIKRDITNICEEKKIDIKSLFTGGNNEENIKNIITKVFLKFTVFVNESGGIKNNLKEFMEDKYNLYIINRGVLIVISLLFSICYHISYMNLFIIATSVILIFLLLMNVVSLIMMEYRPIVNEFLIQDETINNESNITT